MPKLNERQRAAITYLDGPLLVLAGAGSGKTGVITHKIAYLIEECGHDAAHIAAVTFTNKAAREMKHRVGQLLNSKKTRGLRVSTFHTLGLGIVRAEAALLGLRPGFSIFDSADSQGLLRDLLRRANHEEQSAALQTQISHWKNALVTPEGALQAAGSDALHMAQARVYAEYSRHLRAYNAVDFDDLIALPAQLFRDNPEVLQRWQYQIRYLLVDEYQDTNASQYHLVKQLTLHSGRLTVVGDDDQSIYAWRGAQAENLTLLQTDYPQLNVIKLEQNYRSAGNILKIANKLIANNPHAFEKTLWSELGHGEPIRVLVGSDEEDEAEKVTTQLNHQKVLRRAKYADFAILYRSNHQARLFERFLRERNIPYHLTGGTSFFDYAEVKDILAYLRLIVNPDDDSAYLRIANTPRREIGPSTLEKLAAYAQQRGVSLCAASPELGLAQSLAPRAQRNVADFAQWLQELRSRAGSETPAGLTRLIIKDIDYTGWLATVFGDERAAERRMKNVHELVDWLERMHEKTDSKNNSLPDLIARLALLDIVDRQTDADPGDRVQLMTLHAAKGLEFTHVFMVGMDENILPHRNSIEAESIEEERRLCYVGITRARRSLTFSMASQRKRYREMDACEPSRFLAELPQDELVWDSGSKAASPTVTREQGREHLAELRRLLEESD